MFIFTAKTGFAGIMEVCKFPFNRIQQAFYTFVDSQLHLAGPENKGDDASYPIPAPVWMNCGITLTNGG